MIAKVLVILLVVFVVLALIDDLSDWAPRKPMN